MWPIGFSRGQPISAVKAAAFCNAIPSAGAPAEVTAAAGPRVSAASLASAGDVSPETHAGKRVRSFVATAEMGPLDRTAIIVCLKSLFWMLRAKVIASTSDGEGAERSAHFLRWAAAMRALPWPCRESVVEAAAPLERVALRGRSNLTYGWRARVRVLVAQVGGATRRSAGLQKADDLGALATSHDVLQSLIPGAQHMDLALDQVSADVMADQGSGVLAARFVADYRSDKIEGNAHLRQHGRHCAPQVVRGELVDRQLVAAHQQVVSNMGRSQNASCLGREQWSGLDHGKPRLNDLSCQPNERCHARPFVFRARGR